MNKWTVFLWLWVSVAISVSAFAAEVPASVVGLWSSNGAAWDWLDDFDGPNAVLPVGATNSARPGPGAEAVFGTGQVEIMDHVARLQGSAKRLSYAPCALSPSGPKGELACHTPGKAIVAYLGFSDAGLADSQTQHSVGWISSDFVFGHLGAQIGLGIGDPRGGGHPRDIRVQQWQNDGKESIEGVIFKNVLRSGDCLGVAVALTKSGYTVYIQGALAEQWGCILGSNNWFPIFTSTKKLTGKLTGIVDSRYGVPLYVSRFGQMTQFRNDADGQLPLGRNIS